MMVRGGRNIYLGNFLSNDGGGRHIFFMKAFYAPTMIMARH